MADTVELLLEDDKAFAGFASAQVSMLVTNPHLPDNPIVYANEAFTLMTGFSRSAIIGRNCRFLQGEDTNKRDVDRMRAAIEAEEGVTVDVLNYRANGEPFMNRLIVAPIMNEHGMTQYYLGIQKELKQSDIQSMNEDINSQLMDIQNRVTTDLSMIIGMIRQESAVTSVPEDFAALSRRIETLQLLYAEMQLSDLQSNRDTVQMGSFLSRLVAAIAHIEGRTGVRLSLHIEPMEAQIETATRVGLVLSEVMTNAFQHAFDRLDNGLVEVRMSQLSAGGLRLIVSDDGVGIPKDMQWPNPHTVGGRIVSGLIEGLEGTLHLTRGAAGSFVTIDVPAGASAHI